ncbi:ABC transporter transmembrane domain-containing protein [Mesosutterella porci]|uniref:ABC transporter transmembrane domain-containing protein n=1 Tax=Mesosutterella porci TaxID=2915351 RepID=UPI002DD66588|nr:ABC transporter transmembrane domain-containing protein [Mesosutterella sp. oilRF-744-WT-GAM-9]
MHGASMYMSQTLLGRVSQGVLETLRQEMFERILHWPAQAHLETTAGEAASRFANEANAALSGAAKNCITLFRDTAQVIFLTAILLWHDWKLSLVCLALAPVIVAVLPCLRPHALELAAAAIFLTGTAACSFLTATLLGRLTDLSFYSSGDWSAAAPLALIAVTLLFSLCTLCSSALLARVTQKILRDMRGRLFSRLLHWPEETAARWSSGVIASRFVNEANLALSGSIGAFTVLVRDSLQVASLLAVLFWQNWRLTLISFVIGPRSLGPCGSSRAA